MEENGTIRKNKSKKTRRACAKTVTTLGVDNILLRSGLCNPEKIPMNKVKLDKIITIGEIMGIMLGLALGFLAGYLIK